MMSPESWQFSRHSCYSLEGCCEIGIQQGDWTRTLDSLIGKCTFFIRLLSSTHFSLSSLLLRILCNVTPPPTLTDEQSIVSIFRSVMNIWEYDGVVFLITLLVRIHPNLIRPNEK